MHRKFVALGVTLVLAAGLGAAPAQAATAKAGGACVKAGTTTTISKVAYVCTKNNATKKLTWVKKSTVKKAAALSPECVDMKTAYLKMKSQYDTALQQLADTEAKINAVPGPVGDTLRAKFAPSKALILGLGPSVANALAQFNLFC